MSLSFSRARRLIRHSLNVPCQVVRERDFRLVADRVVNLSHSGMLVAPADPVLTGEKIIVSFASPTDGRWIDAQATVSRVIHGRRPGEYQRALGLVFDVVDADSREALDGCLKSLPPSPPGARSLAPNARGIVRALSRVSRHSMSLAATIGGWKPCEQLPRAGDSTLAPRTLAAARSSKRFCARDAWAPAYARVGLALTTQRLVSAE